MSIINKLLFNHSSKSGFWIFWTYQVTADGNLGTWLNNIYGDHDKFEKVLSRVAMDRPHEGFPSPVSVEPISTVNEFVVELRQLDYSQHAKHGCSLSQLVSERLFKLKKWKHVLKLFHCQWFVCWDFPHMATLAVHFKSILYQGFDPYREPLNLRFVSQGDRSIPSFSVRYVDGFSKGLICQSIAAIVDFLASKLHYFSNLCYSQPPDSPTMLNRFPWRGYSRWRAGKWRPVAAFAEHPFLESSVYPPGQPRRVFLWSTSFPTQLSVCNHVSANQKLKWVLDRQSKGWGKRRQRNNCLRP